ncbi:MAG: sugar-binding protein [Salinivirgaceae bacterium]
MKKILTSLFVLVLFNNLIISQTKYDTLVNYIAKTPVTIDGQATEECWNNAEWHEINQVWIPFGATMITGDFEGKFKLAWDELYLYLLVEVVDDSLSDDHSNPLDSWWEDDCLEVFIDENRSMGNHECTNNAFAYHVSQFYDAIDMSPTCGGINYKNHVSAKMEKIAANTFLWEMAFKIYNASYNNSNQEASRVSLTANKLMGLTVAYCDNDETTGRENFIGSMKMTATTNNDMYKNADYFGPMRLIDPDYVGIEVNQNSNLVDINVFPVPTNNLLTVETNTPNQAITSVSIYTTTGQLIKQTTFTGNSKTIDLSRIKTGMYLLRVNGINGSFSKIIIKE